MEIYNDLKSQASQEFEKLLNNQLSKMSIEEGKIIEGKINKITEKFVFLLIEGQSVAAAHFGTDEFLAVHIVHSLNQFN